MESGDQQSRTEGRELQFNDSVIGDTEVGMETSKAVRALTKASRACLLYDFDNSAVADFLHELDLRMERLLEHGPLQLEVRPWELARDEEVVYRERDREKSLAFRLYHDGVRSLTVQPSVTWEELTRLVGILSVRYSDIRQQEDDVVTLLWKADFRHIDFDTVESYSPIDDEADDPGDGSEHVLKRARLYDEDHEFALPWPKLREESDIEFRAIEAEQRNALASEADSRAVAGLSVRLMSQLLEMASDDADGIPVMEVIPLLVEIRDYLLSEGEDALLLKTVRKVHEASQHHENSGTREALLSVFCDREAFARMLDWAIGAERVPVSLVEIVSAAPIEKLQLLMQVMASRWSGTGRTIGRKILTKALGDRVEQFGAIVLEATGSLSGDLLKITSTIDPEASIPLATAIVKRGDRLSVVTALEVLKGLPYRSETGRVLTETSLKAADAEVCAKTAEVLALNGEKRAAPAISRALEAAVLSGAGVHQLTSLARSLARLDPTKAVELFEKWAQSGVRSSRGRTPSASTWQVAIDVLSDIPGEEAAKLLRWFGSRSDGEFKARCARAVAHQKELADSE